MKKPTPIKLFALFAFILCSVFTSYSQGGTCADIQPFCSSPDPLIFPNCNNTDPSCNATAEAGPDYGCLFSQPYPAWFFLQIDQTGDLAFDIIQNTSFDAMGNPNGTGLDVDFIAWGPFDITQDLCDYSLLQAANEVDCSYSIASVEQFTITNAMPGQIYVLLITNFNQSPGFINLQQTNFGTPGSGATDCSIISDNACDGETVTLDATEPGAVNYIWTFDDGVNPPMEIFNGPGFNTIDVFVSGTYNVVVEFAAASTTNDFDVTFFPQPVIASAADDLEICDDGSTPGIFDLTQNDDNTLGAQDPAEFDNITYHNLQADAESGANPIPTPANYTITGNQEEIFIRIENSTGNCFATTSFFINYTQVIAGPMTQLDACDQDGDGTVSLNLPNLKNAQALGTQDPFLYTVSYHPTQTDAENGTADYPTPYVTSNATETIFVRVENNANPLCYATDSFILNVAVAPVLVDPTPYQVCDELPNDGFAEFDLETKTDEITGGPDPTINIEYYTSLTAAQAGAAPIPNPNTFTNTDIGFQVIFVRGENVATPDCFSIVELDLVVNDSPDILDPIPDMVVCDNDGDSVGIFDLRSRELEIAGSAVNVTMTFHTSLADAEAEPPVNVIMPDDAYVSSGSEVVWVRVQNYENGDPVSGAPLCATISSFNLVLGNVPLYTDVPEYIECDDDNDGQAVFDFTTQTPVISNGDASLVITYHPTQMDAEMDTSALPTSYTSTGETVWVRVESTQGCYGIFEMILTVAAPPEIFTPDPLIYCDENNDGFGFFMLSEADEDVVNGNPSGTLVVSYHLTMDDAMNNAFPLDTTTPYPNEVEDLQVIFVLLTDIATGCINITTLDLVVYDTPVITDPSPLVVCDDDNDNTAMFNLTDVEAEMLAGLDPTLYTVSYFVDPGYTSPIGTPTDYINASNPQIVYIVVTTNDPSIPENTCTSETTVELQVVQPPALFDPTPLMLCDVTDIIGEEDEIEIFDLTLSISEITGGDTSIAISFYETLDNAMNDVDPIDPANAYQNTINPQTIYIRAEDTDTGCIVSDGMVTLDLIVNPLPEVVVPTPLEECDDDTDGIIDFFDLDSKIPEITVEADATVTFHESLENAENGTDPLASPYTNLVANNQTIFARVTFTNPPNDTGCFEIVPLELIVNQTPQVANDLLDLVECSDDNFATFDLTVQQDAIYNGQDETWVLTYHRTFADADTGANDILNPINYPNTANPETIFVRLEDETTGCYGTGQFDIVVSQGPAITDPTPLDMCDDVGEPNDGFTVFNLTDKNDEITGGPAPDVAVAYYETQLDAQNATNRIDPEDAYENLGNPQTVYVRVTGADGCTSFTSLDLRVVPNPIPNTPTPQEKCDITEIVGPGPEDNVEIFNLNESTSEIVTTTGFDVTFYEDQTEALEGDPLNAIPAAATSTYENTSNPQIIYVRVASQATSCFEIVELQLIVNPLPDDTAVIEDYIICDTDPFDASAFFDLDTKKDEILGANQDPDDYDVSFFETAADAAAGAPAIVDSQNYQNLDNPQEIFVGITNRATGCYKGGEQSFMIEVVEGAIIGQPSSPYVICDNEGDPGDGIASFDLSDTSDEDVAILRDEILIGQPETDYSISFHETEASAIDGTPSISFPYLNILNPQRVYVRVTNNGSGCFATTELLLQVNPAPDFELEESYRICVDENGDVIPEESGDPSPPLIDTGLDSSLYSFTWEIDGELQVGELGSSIVPLIPGTYTVTVTDLNNDCETIADTNVFISSPPTVFDAIVTSGAFANSHTIEATAEGDGTYEFQLDDGSFQDNGTFNNVSPGQHIVTIRDINGCGSVEIPVSVIDYPRFITPNGDGFHDRWNITGIADLDPTAKIYIFDRYGKLLKQISPLSNGWGGFYNGEALPSDDYWFLVEYTEEEVKKQFRGHFTLKR